MFVPANPIFSFIPAMIAAKKRKGGIIYEPLFMPPTAAYPQASAFCWVILAVKLPPLQLSPPYGEDDSTVFTRF
ncbi:MAG: hypothetical protein LBF78_11445 [Treponema sp.]|jgi:hypothetical protein|nr:hypothetical protein [Treponema sp.]